MGKLAKSATYTSVQIGRRIKKLRDKKDLSLEQLMEITGIHKTNLGRIENGQGCRMETLDRIGAALGVTGNELKWGNNKKEPQAYCLEDILTDPKKCARFLDAERLPAQAQKWAFDSLVTIRKYLDSMR